MEEQENIMKEIIEKLSRRDNLLPEETQIVIETLTDYERQREARSKGGKAFKKFNSDKERYAYHNAKRKKKAE